MRKMYSKKQIEEIAKINGTKLYKHLIEDSNMGYYFNLITTNNQPIDFSVINNSRKLNAYLQSETVISFTGDSGDAILYDGANKEFYFRIIVSLIQNTETCVPSYYDDWDFSKTTDTVSPL